jgi:hypothetical protein
MPASANVNVTSLLTVLGFDQVQLDMAQVGDELVIDTFDTWNNSALSAELPVMGCLCFRESELETIAA